MTTIKTTELREAAGFAMIAIENLPLEARTRVDVSLAYVRLRAAITAALQDPLIAELRARVDELEMETSCMPEMRDEIVFLKARREEDSKLLKQALVALKEAMVQSGYWTEARLLVVNAAIKEIEGRAK